MSCNYVIMCNNLSFISDSRLCVLLGIISYVKNTQWIVPLQTFCNLRPKYGSLTDSRHITYVNNLMLNFLIHVM